MSYSDIKITQADINNNNVRSASDILIGNADDNKAVFDKLPEFIAGKHNDLVDALDEVSEHAQGDTEEIDRLSAEKVNVPKNGTELDFGEAGQMLTTKGNGETQWEDAGQPTDEQTQNAINNWLNEHPEATTTVQDYSLTYNKLVKGTLGFVTPKMFGAVGDGVAVDNSALNECFAFCVSHGIPCYGEGKTYLVDNSTASLAGHYGVVVNGGIKISGCHFKLKSGCPDMTVLLACKYDSNPYVIENCTFEGELRTISAGTEDGGNHGIIFCDGTTMFPSDWQNYADITVRNCTFKNIQSYGIFPTPINNRLTVENCDFSCHGCGILTYATDSVVRNCSYSGLSGSNTTILTLCIDEIENFSSVTAIKKNVSIQNCTSDYTICWLQHDPQKGVIYGDISIENCKSTCATFHSYSPNSPIALDTLTIRKCATDGVGDNALLLAHINGNVILDNISIRSNYVDTAFRGGSIELRNCDINYMVRVGGNSYMEFARFVNCTFSGTPTDGFFTSKWMSPAPTADYIEFVNCIVDSEYRVMYGIDAKNVYVNGLIGTGSNLYFIFNETALDTNVYIDGLIMPTKNADWTYLIENIAGKAVIRGMSAGINTNAVSGGVTKEVTTIPEA